MPDQPLSVELSGVAETLLWPLYARAAESRRSDAMLHDAAAVDLVSRIDYPFIERFGQPQQVLALREWSFDNRVSRFLAAHPHGTVVALADGLNTQYWRLDNGTARWLSVDLPEVIDIRRKLLPEPERARYVACSALDDSWIDLVDTADGVFITAQGLFMYLRGEQAYSIVNRCAAVFPGGTLIFDAMPWAFTASVRGHTVLDTVFMRGKRSGQDGYRLPPMPWHSSFEKARRELQRNPSVAGVRYVPLPRGRGPVFGFLSPMLDRLPVLRSTSPWSALVHFQN